MSWRRMDGIVGRFDLGYVISYNTNTIPQRFGNSDRIHLMLCTDSYSLHQYPIELGTTNEKRL
jgi:hypothetical protein